MESRYRYPLIKEIDKSREFFLSNYSVKLSHILYTF